MFEEDPNECLRVLVDRKRFLNIVCSIIAVVSLALLIIGSVTNTFLSLPIVKGIIATISLANLCNIIATNISFNNAINAEVTRLMSKMDESDYTEYSKSAEQVAEDSKPASANAEPSNCNILDAEQPKPAQLEVEQHLEKPNNIIVNTIDPSANEMEL